MSNVSAEQLKKFLGMSQRIRMGNLLKKIGIPHETKATEIQTDLDVVKAILRPVYARNLDRQRLITISHATGILQKDISDVFNLVAEKRLKCYLVNKQIRLDRLDVYRYSEGQKSTVSKTQTPTASLLMFRVADLSHLLQLSYRRTAYLLGKRALLAHYAIPGRHKVWIEREDVIPLINDILGAMAPKWENYIPEQVPLSNLRIYIPICDKTIKKWIEEGMPTIQMEKAELEVNPYQVVQWLKGKLA